MIRLMILLGLMPFMGFAQENTMVLPPEDEMVSMNNATVNYGGRYGQQYYANGNKEPYTGFLCARYDNGELESVQQFTDGIGNGIWINYNPDGSKESQGTFVNNKTDGPAKLFWENGSIKAEGSYIHLKRKIGWWTFYDREGNAVSKRLFTRLLSCYSFSMELLLSHLLRIGEV